MTPNQIIELAKQAGAAKFYPERQAVTPDAYLVGQDFLQRFALLVRNQVLDEAAKSCNELIEADNSDDYKVGVTWCAMRIEGLKS